MHETPTGEQRRQLENKARLQLALSKTSGTADDFGAKLAQSLNVVRRALDEFGGDTGKSLAVSFNGGKDACVVLYLLLFVLAERDELWRVHSSTTGNKVCVFVCVRGLSERGERGRGGERGGKRERRVVGRSNACHGNRYPLSLRTLRKSARRRAENARKTFRKFETSERKGVPLWRPGPPGSCR